MCEAPICRCHEPMIPDLKVGKAYDHPSQNFGRLPCHILGLDGEYVWYNCGGTRTTVKRSAFKGYVEYKEPVTHKRDVVWCRGPQGNISCFVKKHGQRIEWNELKELHRETVSYTETP